MKSNPKYSLIFLAASDEKAEKGADSAVNVKMKINHKDDIMTGQLYDACKFPEGCMIKLEKIRKEVMFSLPREHNLGRVSSLKFRI
jgi:hypothetical protein